ncbi:putative methionine synthase reductase [Diplonema papillatum]|nr:putative methionine synthase reductase [Diplonema papillatum]
MPPRIGFVFGSQGGTSEAICKSIFAKAFQRNLCDRGSQLLSLNQLQAAGIDSFPVLVIVAATYGDGNPPDNGRKLWRSITKKDTSLVGCMKNVRFGVLGLGDQNYNCFCGFGRDLDVRLGELGGQRFVERGEADEAVGLEIVVEPWIGKVLDLLPRVLEVPPVSYAQSSAPMSFTSTLRDSKKRCFVATIKDGKYEEYVKFHQNIYPEVVRGLRTFGVNSLSLFKVPGTLQVIMQVSLVANIDFNATFGLESEYQKDPRCKEWETLAGASFLSGWVECEEFHSSEQEWPKALGIIMEKSAAENKGLQ